MADVMIKCPETGEPVRTGVKADRAAFVDNFLEDGTVSCPHCDKIHTWNKEHAWFADA